MDVRMCKALTLKKGVVVFVSLLISILVNSSSFIARRVNYFEKFSNTKWNNGKLILTELERRKKNK